MKIQFLLIYLQLICNMNLYIEDRIIVYHSLVVSVQHLMIVLNIDEVFL